MTDVVKLFKALGDESRLRILAALAKETYCVCDLARFLDIPQPTLSHHLKVLRDIGLVKGEKDGQWIYCSLNSELLEPSTASMSTASWRALEREAAPRRMRPLLRVLRYFKPYRARVAADARLCRSCPR